MTQSLFSKSPESPTVLADPIALHPTFFRTHSVADPNCKTCGRSTHHHGVAVLASWHYLGLKLRHHETGECDCTVQVVLLLLLLLFQIVVVSGPTTTADAGGITSIRLSPCAMCHAPWSFLFPSREDQRLRPPSWRHFVTRSPICHPPIPANHNASWRSGQRLRFSLQL